MENKFCSGCSQWIPDVTQQNGVCQTSIRWNTLPAMPCSVGTAMFPVLVTSQNFGCINFAPKEVSNAMEQAPSPIPSEQREPADERAESQHEAGVARQPGADSQRPGDEAEEVPQAPVAKPKFRAAMIAHVILSEMVKYTDWPEMERLGVASDAESSAERYDPDRRIGVGVMVRPIVNPSSVTCTMRPIGKDPVYFGFEAETMERHFKDLGVEGIQVIYAQPIVRKLRAVLNLP